MQIRSTAAEGHGAEVARGERFEFGKNWARFLRVLSEDRIRIAERSLVSILGMERLDGLTFLDIGSGSGLFSLCARRLGATVHSFDYDPQSVACTQELKRRYFAADSAWTIEQGSVLDQTYLDRLGSFDIVYSWGVLHHTGQMWEALDRVKPAVKMGGKLVIAIYNDLGDVTDRWARVKQTYGRLSPPFARLYALAIVAGSEGRSLLGHLRRGQIGAWVRSWSQYEKESTRGMSRWHDWIDWIGGYPYERATIEQIVDHYAKDGFRLVNLVDRSNGYGCNEFVFCRVQPLNTRVDVQIPGGSSLLQRFGRRVLPPFERSSQGWTGALEGPEPGESAWLFRSGELIGPARFDTAGRVIIALPDEGSDSLEETSFHVVSGDIRQSSHTFEHVRGNMWSWETSDLQDRADTLAEPTSSSVFVLQDGRQLEHPHALHDSIAQKGGGRFSHWGNYVYFAARDNHDPRKAPDRFKLFIPLQDAEKCERGDFPKRPAEDSSNTTRVPARRWMPRTMPPTKFAWIHASGLELLRRSMSARRLQPLLDRRECAVLATLQSPGDFPFRSSRAVERRVLLGSGTLDGGGAERQILNTIEGLRARGLKDVHLLVEYLDPGQDNAFYLDKAVRVASSIVRPAARDYGVHPWVLDHPAFRAAVFDWLANQTLKNAETIKQVSPEIVQCSLDWPNITIGMAAVLAGVPHVFLSGRNLSPRHFEFFQWFMYPCYRALAACPNVTFLNNSEAGRHDYAAWLRLQPEEIRLVRNGLHAGEFSPVSYHARAAARHALGIDADAKVVVGAFRLSREKRPLLWVETAARIKANLGDALFLHCGLGPMQAQVETRARRRGLNGSLKLLGSRRDVQAVFAAADVVLQTSLQEGTPNTLIEAQAMGIPVVTTPACGAAEAVEDGVTGLVVREETAHSLATAVLAILSNPSAAVRARQAGPACVEARFGFRRMIDDTLAAYHAAGVEWAAELPPAKDGTAANG